MFDLETFRADFVRRHGRAPTLHRAPGRVNLIGEHTDYNDGFVMPAALEHATWVAVAPRADRVLTVHSSMTDESRSLDLDRPPARSGGTWADYVFGVALMLERAGLRLTGADLTIASTVPVGAGLSSSAALEVSVGHALLDSAGLPIDTRQLALVCQRAENEWVGMRCGIMDQYIAARGVAGRALMIDCRSLEDKALPIDPAVRVIVADSMVRHQLAGGDDYNSRRRACETGVARLREVMGEGVRALRDVGLGDLLTHRDRLDDVTFRRCRHIVTENERVEEAARALEAGDAALFGALMDASHVSMRDDYEISCPAVDTLVSIARATPGVLGSRMTGGGFGGCTVSLVRAEAADEAMGHIRAEYQRRADLTATVFACSPGPGVARIDT